MSDLRAIELPSAREVEAVAHGLLIGAKGHRKFPTPVNDIVAYSELAVDQNVDLANLANGIVNRHLGAIQKFARKVLGMVDIREKVIYLDHQQSSSRKAFIKLHEVGHFALPWQRDTFLYLDDKDSLDHETKLDFEREANYLASCVLFQGDIFNEEASLLELSIKAPMLLADKFGASHQATIRRYVLNSRKRCAVLVLNAAEAAPVFQVPLRNCFESAPFRAEFGEIVTPKHFGTDFSFVLDVQRRRRLHTKGAVRLETSGAGIQEFEYHFYFNFYNTFVFLMPAGEKILLGKSIRVG
jgi:Zn-dependent peptidase ImmA (M78 family)